MKWFLIFNPFACLKLLLLGICVFTIGYLLAIKVLIIEIGDANGCKHKIASDPEHVYSSPLQHRHTSYHEMTSQSSHAHSASSATFFFPFLIQVVDQHE